VLVEGKGGVDADIFTDEVENSGILLVSGGE